MKNSKHSYQERTMENGIFPLKSWNYCSHFSPGATCEKISRVRKSQKQTPRPLIKIHILKALVVKQRSGKKQEYIPIGCVTPARLPYSAVSDGGRGGLPTPPGCRPTLQADPPWMQTPRRQTFPLWTEWCTGVKTLPCPKLRLRAVKMYHYS